jgi:hypothetical protein
MRSIGVLWLLLPAFVLGCTRAPLPSPPPAPVGRIAVFPLNNRTGDSLLVASDSFWNPYAAGAQRVTVADLLAAEARAQLERRGFTVAAADAVDAAVGTFFPGSPQEAAEVVARSKLADTILWIEITRWEPDMTLRPKVVLVALEASLIDVATGTIVWNVHRSLRPAPTPGAISLWVAHMIAAHEVVEELLAGWRLEQPAS